MKKSPWAMITGASSGIGKACAEKFADAGYSLILLARRLERLEKLALHLQKSHAIETLVLSLDIRDHLALEKSARQHVDKFRQVSCLINNAGLSRDLAPLQSGKIKDWEEMIDTNIKGVLYMTRLILPRMIECGAGHIINIASISGHQPYPGGSVYCATKAAVCMISESLRLDLHGTGVRVSNISPGMLESEFSIVRFHGDEARAKKVYEGTRPLQSEDVAAAALWCTQQPPHVNIQELIIMPTDQASTTMVHRHG